MKIKLFEPFIDNAEKTAVMKALESKFWASGSGSGHVSKFENKFKKYVKSNTCIAVNSGTTALELSLKSLGISKNDEIIKACTREPIYVSENALVSKALSIMNEKKITSLLCSNEKEYKKGKTKFKLKGLIHMHRAIKVQ